MTAMPGWGGPGNQFGGGRPDLTQIMGTLPQREQRQLGQPREQTAVRDVAGMAGSETLWGLVSCRADTRAGVLALTDGRLLICLASIVNGQVQVWRQAVPLADVGAVEFESGGLGQRGCVASIAYGGNVVLGMTVGKDTEYAAAFLRMLAEQTEEAARQQGGGPVPGVPSPGYGVGPVPVPGRIPTQPGVVPGLSPWQQGQVVAPAAASVPGQGVGPVVVPIPLPGPTAGTAPATTTTLPDPPGTVPGVPSAGDAGLAGLVRDGLRRLYPGQWVDWMPGASCSIAAHGGGTLVYHDDGKVGVVAHALTGLGLSPELVADLADLNGQASMGGFYLRRGTSSDTWELVYGYSVFARWLAPASPAAAQVLYDILAQAPVVARWGAERIKARHGGSRPEIGDVPGWQSATMSLR